ncbi:MAG TPA: UDP-N-acetylmuramoyl-L-alanine--D-glutamate ligase [Cyclobacteriaceae bacterium]
MRNRITILGAGESGTGAAILAKARGYDVFVSDRAQISEKSKTELLSEGISFEEGGHTEEQVLNTSLVVRSPGIPDQNPLLVKARAASIEVIDEIEFAFRHIKGNVIAITGTNGKTTTTLLTYHLMKEAGFGVSLAGNVGISFARQVAKHPSAWYVLEVSSFQLDGITSFNPFIGILLNITPDHMDRYDNSMQKYTESKFRLIRNMDEDGYFIWFMDDPVIAEEVSRRDIRPHQVKVSLKVPSDAYYDGSNMNFSFPENFKVNQKETTLVGPHNLINTMAAVSAAYFAGAPSDSIRKGLRTFRNAPHRLESVGIINGVEFINDSKATNVDAVSYALGSYEGPLVWIAGGTDKGNDYRSIRNEVGRKVRALICLGKDNEKLKQAFKDVVRIIRETRDVHELVKMALELARSGDVVLLSPACASFDLFRNYEDRGDQFRAAVKELKKEVEGAAA